ncbi:putative ribosomal protein L33, partial [Toxoplasma gondii RUB]
TVSMFFTSPVLLRSRSKRLFVQLKSAAMTNFCYVTRKSPEKKNFRIALRKYDPGVNKHV